MPEISLVLFDDDIAARWEPFALTRPAGELMTGALTQRARAERVFGVRCVASLVPEHLVGFEEEGAPPSLGYEQAPTEGDRLFWLARAIPDWSERGRPLQRPGLAGPIRIGEQVVGWRAPAGEPAPPPDFFRTPTERVTEGSLAVEGRVLREVWELVSCNADQLSRDVRALFPSAPAPALPEGVFHWGEHPLIVDESARIEPGCAIDTSEGPVWIDREATVHAFTRLCGPAYIGPGSELLGGSVSCVSLGPVSKIRGEFTTSVALGYSNKQHDGHIGHAYLGRWVNLGAETTNSDLKNNYGNVDLWTPDGPVDTGEMKMGSLLGDHVKTGIGLLLNTGTVIGAGSNLYGAAMPPKFVPPFSWGTGEQLVEYRLDKFLEVAEVAMARREVSLTEGERAQLRRAWERSAMWRGPETSDRG